MGFEHNNYRELWKDLPGPGTKIKAPNANYILSGVDISRETVRLYCPGSGEVVVPVSDFKDFRETVMRGEAWTRQTVEVPQSVIVPDEIMEPSDKGARSAEDPDCVREEISGQKKEYSKNRRSPEEKTGNSQKRRGGPNRRKPAQSSQKKNEDKKPPGGKEVGPGAGADKPAQGKSESRKRSRRRRPRKPNSPSTENNT